MTSIDTDIALVYDAATDRSKWPSVLEKFASALGADYVGLGLRNDRQQWVRSVIVGDPSFENATRYGPEANPLIKRAPHLPLCAMLPDGQIVPRRILVESEFYQDFLDPMRLQNILGTILWRETPHYCSLMAARSMKAGAFSGRALDYCRILVPHLARAAAVSSCLARAQLRSLWAEAALDQLSYGVVLLSSACRVCFLNAEAKAIAAARNGFWIGRGGVVTDSGTAGAKLSRAIAEAVAPDAQGSAIRLPRREGHAPLTVLIVPIESPLDWLGQPEPATLLILSDPERGHAPLEQQLRQLYGLSAAEAAVAVDLAAGRGLKEIAETRETSLHTVRIQLRRIMAKTEVSRQSDLIRVLLRDSGALIGRRASH